LCSGCNKAGKLSEPSTKPMPTGPVELKLKWPAGERMVQDMDMKMNMEISVPNQPAPIHQDITMGEQYALKVLNTQPDGGREVELEFLSMRMTVAQGGKTLIDYDSGKKASANPRQPDLAAIEKTFQSIIGAKIQYYLDASNQVERIEGVDALMNRLSAGGRADAAASLKSTFSEDTLKQMISGQHLPPHPVQPGDSWPVDVDVSLGQLGTMSTDYTFNFASWEKHGVRNCARLEFQGALKSKSDAGALPSGMTMSVKNGDSSGVSWFDPELGLVVETVMNQNIDMIMTIPMRVQGKTTTQTLTTAMKQAITVKLESVK